MSLSKVGEAVNRSGFVARTLDAPMDRREFLQMSGTLILTLIGVNSLLGVIAKHTGQSGSSIPVMAGQSNGFGSRKFGQ